MIVASAARDSHPRPQFSHTAPPASSMVKRQTSHSHSPAGCAFIASTIADSASILSRRLGTIHSFHRWICGIVIPRPPLGFAGQDRRVAPPRNALT